MIRILKFKVNDLKPSGGKQVEFTFRQMSDIFNIDTTLENVVLYFNYINERGEQVGNPYRSSFTRVIDRSNYKLYANEDGSKNLKSLFVEDLNLGAEQNVEDYFAIQDTSLNNHFNIYYLSRDFIAKDFFNYLKADKNSIEVYPLFEEFNELSFNNSINYITALRTKPFLLLAGISGTGKSQKVQELAYMTCPQRLASDPTMPGNYCLIEVKPNWHDSTELLGYYSSLTEKYELTDFVRFVYKATQNPDVPFFVCLDEMNLAPVEQYFAEYLSVLETRKLINGKIVSAPLLTKETFKDLKTTKRVEAYSDSAYNAEVQTEPKSLYTPEDVEVIKYLQENGLRLPENLFVIGTVNMDDTTHQFSRKVIDRAFTIEMNGGNLEDMFDEKEPLVYLDDPVKLSMFKPQFVRAKEVLEAFSQYRDTIVTNVPQLLNDINQILKNTPFRVSYRVQNELILYIGNILLENNEVDDVAPIINEAFLNILLEKILPRVEGEEKLLKSPNGGSTTVFDDLLGYIEAMQSDEGAYNNVKAKLIEMRTKLKNSYFTNFFS